MAVDKIILDYEVGTEGAKASLKDLTTEMKRAEEAAKKSSDSAGRSFKTTAGIIDNTSRSVRNLDKALTNVGGPATRGLKNVDNSAKTTTSTFDKLGKGVSNFGAKIGGLNVGLGQLAATMGLAFGAQQIIAGLKESVNQFAEAELNAKKLAFAVKEIGGEGEAAFNRLLAQSGDLQSVSIFSDDDIQQAQTALLQYGLTTDQVEKLIPAIVDLASATGENLSSAQERVLSGINGQTKGLKDIGLQFKDTGDKTKNYEKILEGLNRKFDGATAAALDTTAGKLANLKNQFGELQETVGGEIVPVLTDLVGGLNGLFENGVNIDDLDKIGNAFDSLTVVLQALPTPIAGFIRGFKDARAALEAFQSGDILGGVEKGVSAMLNVMTFGVSGQIKQYFFPTMEKVEDVLTDFERKQLDVANATDQQLNAKFKELSATTGITKESWDQFVTAVRTSKIEQTFQELANVLDITEKQYQKLVNISDKYGISARINSSLIMDIRKATDQDLNVAFENFNKTLGVTRKDFDDYIGRVKDIKSLNMGVAESTKQMVGPYDALSKSVSTLMKHLQDQATLFEKGLVSWDSVTNKAIRYAKYQNELVAVNDKVTESLKRPQEALLLYGEATQVVISQVQTLAEKFKLTEDQIRRRDDLMQQLGITQSDNYAKQKKDLEALEAAEIKASDGTIKAIQSIIDKYKEANLVLEANNIANIAGQLSNLTETLNNSLSQIFGEAAQNSVAFASFQKAITLTTVALKSAEAIASGIAAVAAGASSGDPIKLIGGITSIIAGVGNIIGGIVQTVNDTAVPSAPSFFDGTPYLQRGNNPKGIDTIPVYANEGEAIIPTARNASEPGLAQAWIDGNLDRWIINNKLPELADMIPADSPAYLETFHELDDERLYQTGVTTAQLLQENNSLLKKSINMNNKNPWSC